MKAAKIVKTVRPEGGGGLKIDVREYADGRYGFDISDEYGARKKVRLDEEDAAIERAEEHLGKGSAGKLDMMRVDRKLFEEFLLWRAQQKPKVRIPALVESFVKSKKGKGRSEWHMRGLANDLKLFARAFQSYLTDLRREDVEAWLDSGNRGSRRWNNLRAAVMALHKFARRERLLGVDLTPVETIPKRFHRPKIETYSPEEFRLLLLAAEPEWMPALVFGGLCGCRPEELCPDPRDSKPGLRWEHVLWGRQKIDMPAEVSKVRRRRFIPLCEAAEAMLAPWRWAKGPVLPRRRLTNVSWYWSDRSKVTWKADGLRHSYASYRLALTMDVPALSLEMGNSPAVIHAHYLDLKHEEEAVEWFSLTPGPSWTSMELFGEEIPLLQAKKGAEEGT